MKKLLTLLLFPLSVHADWTIHTVSDHLNTSGLNNINPGIAYDFSSIRIGGVYNSYKRPTFYVAKILPVNSRFRIGLGVISGYKLENSRFVEGDSTDILPLIAAEVDLTDQTSIVWFGNVINLEVKF